MMTGRLSNKQIRDLQRVIHLATALALGACIYLPLGTPPQVAALLKFGVIPVLAVSGLLMWQWTRLRRWLQAPERRVGAPAKS